MSGRIPDALLDQIRSSVDIVDIVSEYVPLQKRGRNYFGLCPFHGEKTPSFSVNQEKQIYHCFGCHVGGNVFSFLMEMERISFSEAVRTLAGRAGLTLSSVTKRGEQEETNDEFYRANDLAQRYYQYLLRKDRGGARARKYLEDRGVSDRIIELFGLGYAPPEWDGLLKVAAKRSLSGEILEKAGLALLRKSGAGYYDRFRDRVMFPIFSISGRTIGFGARALEEEQEPKYLNSPETPIYHKGSVLYGLRQAKEPIGREKTAIVVEGYMDLLRLMQEGISHAVATAGTALTSDHARMLRRYAERVILVYDADPAGVSASLRSVDVLLEGDVGTYVVSLPEGYDPDRFVQERGPDAFYQLLERAEPVVAYKLRMLAESEDLTAVDGKTRAVASLVETVSKVKNEIRRNLMIHEVSERLGVDEGAIIRAVTQMVRRERRGTGEERVPETGSLELGSRIERELLKMIIGRREIAERTKEEIGAACLSDGPYRRVAEMIFDLCEEGRNPDAASLINLSGDATLSALISELSSEGFDESEVERSLEDHFLRLKWNLIDQQIVRVNAALKEAQDQGDEAMLQKLLAESHALQLRKRSLRKPQKNT